MPIAASFPVLQPQLKASMSLGPAGNASIIATLISSALSSVVPMGMFPLVPSPIPLTPVGFSACKTMIENSMNLKEAANIDTVALMMANGISLMAPLAPPVGLTYLQSQIKNALNLGQVANADIIALTIASAIPQYYMMGGII